MIFLFNLFYQFGDALSFLLLAAIGLAVIFGMMKIINLAHGEFITIGAYGTVVSAKILKLPLPLAMSIGVLVTVIFKKKNHTKNIRALIKIRAPC